MKFPFKHSILALLLSVSSHCASAQSTTVKEVEKAATEMTSKLKLKADLGVGYGQTAVLYSKPTAYAQGGVQLTVPLSKSKTVYEKLQITASKEGINGRLDAGIEKTIKKGRKVNFGIYASNDFKAKTFLIVDNPLNPKTVLAQEHSGLIQAGITAGLVQSVSKNMEIFVKGDVGGAAYSQDGECVSPFKTRTLNYIDKSKSSYVLKDGYNYEKGVRKGVAAVEAGLKTKVKNLDIVCKGGYNTYNGSNFAVGGVYHFNLIK